MKTTGKTMKPFYIASLAIALSTAIAFSPLAIAGENVEPAPTEQQTPVKKKRAKLLTGTPVHTAIAGGGTLPKGSLLTTYNSSLADRTNGKKGYKGSDVYSQVHLLKIRYGLTNHWELTSTAPYINNGSRNPKPSNRANNIEGYGDQLFGFTYAPYQFHQGDPLAISLSAGITAPTGTYGNNHVPGNGAWGGRLATGIATFFTDDIRFDTEVVMTTSFENGNQKVRKGNQYQWNTQVRYLFDWFDIGVESVYTHSEDGTGYRPGRGGRVNLHNGGKEWHVGPSTSIAIDPLDMWVGFGVFFPVMQDMNGPSVVDDVQYHFKVAKMW